VSLTLNWPETLNNTIKLLVTIACASADFRTRHLPNVNQRHYRLGELAWLFSDHVIRINVISEGPKGQQLAERLEHSERGHIVEMKQEGAWFRACFAAREANI
jgi:hypothetical protein